MNISGTDLLRALVRRGWAADYDHKGRMRLRHRDHGTSRFGAGPDTVEWAANRTPGIAEELERSADPVTEPVEVVDNKIAGGRMIVAGDMVAINAPNAEEFRHTLGDPVTDILVGND